jgi:hypothetical protein
MPLTPADVGHRVVVRSRVPGETGPTGGPAFTDVIGVLETWAEHTLSVRRADGRLVRVAEALVVAGKRVPPPPRRP